MDTVSFGGVGPVVTRHAFDVERVAAFMERSIPGFAGPVTVEQFRGGQSNPTFRLTSPSGRYVLRRKPLGPTLATAHAVDREFRVTGALHSLGVPVARPLAYCDDAAVMETPFFIAEHVDGRIFWNSRLPEVRVDERRDVYAAACRTLATLHAVDVERAGLADFGKRGDYFRRQIARWSEQYRRARTRALPAMDALVGWLGEHPPASSGRESVIHGDFRLDNIIFAADEGRVSALIDWELSTIGDPLADLSYQCMAWRLPAGMFGSLRGADVAALGIPTEEEYVQIYLQATGAAWPADWDTHLVFNMFRIAAILEGVARRALDGNASSAHASAMAAQVEPISEAAWDIARRL